MHIYRDYSYEQHSNEGFRIALILEKLPFVITSSERDLNKSVTFTLGRYF